jgi:hypothetical protein
MRPKEVKEGWSRDQFENGKWAGRKDGVINYSEVRDTFNQFMDRFEGS